MENEGLACIICSFPYDTIGDHIPRVLINCGHTLCTSCLIEMIKNPNLQKCPLDSIPFKRSQNCLDHFPRNFALLALLERKKRKTCEIHDEELKMFCLKDNVKICSDCAFFGEHKEHETKWIKELKSKGAKLKKDLEESLKKFEKKEQDVETVKNEFLKRTEEKLEDVKKTLETKEVEWKKQMENLFGRNVDRRMAFIKRRVERALEEIDQAHQKEENLTILDQDFGSIVSRLQIHVTQEEALKAADETSKLMDCIESFLTNQVKTLEDFDLSKERVKPEQCSGEPVFFQILPLFSLSFSSEGFFIWVKNPNPTTDPTIKLETFNKLKRISIKLDQYDSLFQNSIDLKFLSQVLHQLNNFTSLTVSFAPEGLTDSRALHLLNVLFERVQHLTEIEISFERCEISDGPILFFCTESLSEAISLKSLTVKVGSTQISDESLYAFATSLSSLKDLEDLRLDGSRAKITEEGVKAVFLEIPKNIRRLTMTFEEIKLSNEVVSKFEDEVSPKLELMEEMYLRAEGKDLEYQKGRTDNKR